MAKNKWSKLRQSNALIIEVLTNHPSKHFTTNGLRSMLNKKYNLIIGWHALQNRLMELAEAKHIKEIIVEKEGARFHIWTLRGI